MAKLRKLFSVVLLVVALSLNVIPAYVAEYPKPDIAGFSETGHILVQSLKLELL